MRIWQLSASDPLALRLAADVRQVHTDYADDQIWELVLGEGQSPALALETRYGGRCGLARLVPMWVIGGRAVYEASAYAAAPIVEVFWPGYLRLAMRPASELAVTAEYWAMESHAIGGRFTLRNLASQPVEVGVDMVAQIMTAGQAGDINLLTLDNGQVALHLQNVGELQPVIMMHAVTPLDEARPKLAARVTVPSGEQTAIRWVHAARPSRSDSLNLATKWLYKEDWNRRLKALEDLNTAVPVIETGDRERDAAIAFSLKVTLASFVGPTRNLPHPSLIFTRIPGRGYSARRDGSDHYWQWSGQSVPEAYVALSGIASAAPDLARGAFRNYLAAADSTGFIDGKPGLGGQRSGLLAMPLLASLALNIYLYTEDLAFVQEVFPGLLRFFERWFSPDMDADGDGFPEWRSIDQAGFANHPSFAPHRRWSQNIDIARAECPDLAAYLIREAHSLQMLADLLARKDVRPALQERQKALLAHLDRMWCEETGSFHYRDRDTHITVSGGLIAEGPASAALLPSLELDPPNCLLVRVQGGRDFRPTFSVLLEGIAADGSATRETLTGDSFIWYRSMGAAMTGQRYARIDRITAQGLSRVYNVQVASADWTHQDQTLLLPLWAGIDDPGRREKLIGTITDPARYWRPYGIPACPAQESAYDPANSAGCGGVWMFWNLLIGEGLIEAGRPDLAADLLSRLLIVQIHALRTQKAFQQAYNSDVLAGLGDDDYVSGVVPLHLLWRLMGIRIISPKRVLVGGEYALPWPVRVQQHGVTVTRDAEGTRVTFPSGAEKRVRTEKWRVIEDGTASNPRPPADRSKSRPARNRARSTKPKQSG